VEEVTIHIPHGSINRQTQFTGPLDELLSEKIRNNRMKGVASAEQVVMRIHTGLSRILPEDVNGRTQVNNLLTDRTHKVTCAIGPVIYGGTLEVTDREPLLDAVRSAKISFYIPKHAKARSGSLASTHWDFYFKSTDDAPIDISADSKTNGLLRRLKELFGLTLRGKLRSDVAASIRQLVDTTISNPEVPTHPVVRRS